MSEKKQSDLVAMVREVALHENGAVTAMVPADDVAEWEKHGWRRKDKDDTGGGKKTKGKPGADET